MSHIQNGYTKSANGPAAEALFTSRSNGSLSTMRAAIASLVIAKTEADKANALERFEGGRSRLVKWTQGAAAADPSDAAETETLAQQVFAAFNNDCAHTIQLARASQDASAASAAQDAFRAECLPPLEPLADAYLKRTAAMALRAQSENEKLAKETQATIVTTFVLMLGGLSLAVAGGLVAVKSGIVTPMTALSATMERLAMGELSAMVAGTQRRDEIGAMCRAVQVFKDAGIAKVALESQADRDRRLTEQERQKNEELRAKTAADQALVVSGIGSGLEKLSSGDLTFRLSIAFSEHYEKLRTDFNVATAQLQEAMKAVVSRAEGLRSGVAEITQASDHLARRTEQQAANLEQAAAALDEITTTVKQTAEGALHAAKVVAQTKAQAETSSTVVRDAVAAMSAIEKSSSDIGKILSVIDEIAFQTNLLALNAGVEAARAGDAGRGFAVVASEVRALAQRSAEAAKEIKSLISTSATHVDAGVGLVDATGKALDAIASQVGDISAVVANIAASAQEQANGLRQVNAAINQMDQMTQQNAAMVEQSTAASHALSQEAGELTRLIAQFKVGDPARGQTAVGPRRQTPTPAAAPPPRAKVAASAGRHVAAATADNGWSEF